MHHTHNASHPQESEWDSGSCHDVRHHTVQYKHVNRMYPCTSETNKIKDNNTWNLPKQTQSKKKNSPLEHYSNVRLNCVTGRSHIHWACPDYKYILIFIRIYMQSSDQIPCPRPRGYGGCGGSLEVKRSMAAARLHVTTGSWGDALR